MVIVVVSVIDLVKTVQWNVYMDLNQQLRRSINPLDLLKQFGKLEAASLPRECYDTGLLCLLF